MSVRMPVFDRLPQGVGYQSVPAPTSDAADTPSVSTQVPDSHNDGLSMKVVSLATQEERNTIGEWNTWNSGWRSDAQIGHDDGAIGAK